MRVEFFRAADGQHATLARLHQSCGGRPPIERFRFTDRSVAPDDAAVSSPRPAAAASGPRARRRPAGARQVNVRGGDHPGRVLLHVLCRGADRGRAGRRGPVDILHIGVVVAIHAQRFRADQADRAPRDAGGAAGTGCRRRADRDPAGQRRRRDQLRRRRLPGRPPLDPPVHRCRVRSARQGRQDHPGPPIRHDRARELGAFANPKAPAARTQPPAMSPSYRNSPVVRVPELNSRGRTRLGPSPSASPNTASITVAPPRMAGTITCR